MANNKWCQALTLFVLRERGKSLCWNFLAQVFFAQMNLIAKWEIVSSKKYVPTPELIKIGRSRSVQSIGWTHGLDSLTLSSRQG